MCPYRSNVRPTLTIIVIRLPQSVHRCPTVSELSSRLICVSFVSLCSIHRLVGRKKKKCTFFLSFSLSLSLTHTHTHTHSHTYICIHIHPALTHIYMTDIHVICIAFGESPPAVIAVWRRCTRCRCWSRRGSGRRPVSAASHTHPPRHGGNRLLAGVQYSHRYTPCSSQLLSNQRQHHTHWQEEYLTRWHFLG